MMRFNDFIIVTSDTELVSEGFLNFATKAAVATYILRQGAIVKQKVAQVHQNIYIERKIDSLADALQAVSSKITATAAVAAL